MKRKLHMEAEGPAPVSGPVSGIHAIFIFVVSNRHLLKWIFYSFICILIRGSSWSLARKIASLLCVDGGNPYGYHPVGSLNDSIVVPSLEVKESIAFLKPGNDFLKPHGY
jgi:hypothetical protein